MTESPLRIFVGTGTRKKLVEYALIFQGIGAELYDTTQKSLSRLGLGALAPPAEDGETFFQNASLKARYYADLTGLPSFSDDSGLMVRALGGAPGVLSSRYGLPEDAAGLSEREKDRLRNARLLREIEGVEEREAVMAVSGVLARPRSAAVLSWEGTLFGLIAKEPKGELGFGYDPVFYVPEKGRTLGEMTREEKEAISHRGQVIRKVTEDRERILRFLKGEDALEYVSGEGEGSA